MPPAAELEDALQTRLLRASDTVVIFAAIGEIYLEAVNVRMESAASIEMSGALGTLGHLVRAAEHFPAADALLPGRSHHF
jgi:DNA-binding transcriptional LysR family regulator